MIWGGGGLTVHHASVSAQFRFLAQSDFWNVAVHTIIGLQCELVTALMRPGCTEEEHDVTNSTAGVNIYNFIFKLFCS